MDIETQWLYDLEKGNEVIVYKPYHGRQTGAVQRVWRITPTQVVLRDTTTNHPVRFRKDDGGEIGISGRYRRQLSQWTEEAHAWIELAAQRAAFLESCRNITLETVNGLDAQALTFQMATLRDYGVFPGINGSVRESPGSRQGRTCPPKESE